MDLHELDIVYFVKDTEINEELKYSLRSIDKNFPHRSVVFVGGKPDNLTPDRWIHVKQNKETKWDNTSLLMRTTCLDEDISDSFVLFNDDFFVMKPIEYLPYYSDGFIRNRILSLKIRHHKETKYSKRLQQTIDLLESKNLPTISYAVHFPMIINKREMLETFEEFPEGLMWRSLYGNHHKKPVTYTPDCKIYDYSRVPDNNSSYLSTSDKSFRLGLVGTHVREKFLVRCKYEESLY